ncbi:hypothetical protein BW737_004665 [Actinomyces ruminis]|uniref:DUF1624 domain-containing protein n=1 Tax=Actinomyces ruminis TaxID=1937003 RepID=A0ABX4MCF4_9ACTO|nr:hypothetical protein BW737_004665 [Actinomyces ruminis]
MLLLLTFMTTLVLALIAIGSLVVANASGNPYAIVMVLIYGLLDQPGWLLVAVALEVVALAQMRRRRPASAAAGLLGLGVPILPDLATSVAYSQSEVTVLGGSSVGAALRLVLLPLVIATGVAAVMAGRRGMRAQPAAVSVGVGASLFLLLLAVIEFGRASLSLVWFAFWEAIAPEGGRVLEIGLWLFPMIIDADVVYGLPFLGVGGVVLVAACAFGMLAVIAWSTRMWRAFIAGAIGGPVVLLVHHLAVWAVYADILSGWRLPWMGLTVLGPGILLAMSLAAVTPAARQWFTAPRHFVVAPR